MQAKHTKMLLGLIVMALASPAPAAPSVRASVEANYARFNAAFQREDLDGMFATLTDDFTLSMPGKTTMNAIQTRQVYAALFGSMKRVDGITQTVQSFHAHGRVADTTVRMVVKFTTQDETGKHKGVQTTTWRDAFVRKAGGWKLRRAVNLTQRLTIDGKAVTP
ncbi:MAG: nuclear transport factor 2 family protein [Armatimonadota bacterium]|nr:nuclear transport factor 2 family protein [Armatimonadota bacterium]